ncbi:tkl family protein kinase [Nannochloropsis gaditana]|uniref:Tkl family protein kinase n=1 Tax=Nannochloropsis gaditana TaxID=72520 RepID=W7T0H8_9STRA|nr:tkl family protein kinase [Nannochloropsis gaditana]
MLTQSEPWARVTHAQVAFNILSGKRLKIPINTDPVLADIMRRCWEQNPRWRPNFEYIYYKLRERFVTLQNQERAIGEEKALVVKTAQTAV